LSYETMVNRGFAPNRFTGRNTGSTAVSVGFAARDSVCSSGERAICLISKNRLHAVPFV